ncbi:MAG: acetate uptake transporter [Burkholderiaceae bacterium]|jgi:succinate-acetate transporter protein|nr:acetate uptake transporter [Burkholderiaceae bacterium]
MSNISIPNAAIEIKDATANPGPMGLLAFGMTTLLLNISLAGFTSLNSLVLLVEIFTGGILQVIAGILDWKKGNTFGSTVFISAGFFWVVLALQTILPAWSGGAVPGPTPVSEGFFLLMWTAFVVVLFVGAIKMRNRSFQIVLAVVAILFFIASVGALTRNPVINTISGYFGIFCGVLSIFVSLKQFLGEVDKVVAAEHAREERG